MADSTRYARGAPPIHTTTPLPSQWLCDVLNVRVVRWDPTTAFPGSWGEYSLSRLDLWDPGEKGERNPRSDRKVWACQVGMPLIRRS